MFPLPSALRRALALACAASLAGCLHPVDSRPMTVRVSPGEAHVRLIELTSGAWGQQLAEGETQNGSITFRRWEHLRQGAVLATAPGALAAWRTFTGEFAAMDLALAPAVMVANPPHWFYTWPPAVLTVKVSGGEAHVRLVDGVFGPETPLGEGDTHEGTVTFVLLGGPLNGVRLFATAPGLSGRRTVWSATSSNIDLALAPASDAEPARISIAQAQATTTALPVSPAPTPPPPPSDTSLEAFRRDYLARHPELPVAAIKAIANETLIAGLTFEGVTAALGPPTRKTLEGGVEGETEVWTYLRDASGHVDVLTFKENLLIRWSLSR